MSFFDSGSGEFLNLDEYVKQMMADLTNIRPLSAAGFGVGYGERQYDAEQQVRVQRPRADFTMGTEQLLSDSHPSAVEIADWLAPGSEVMLTDSGLAAVARQVTEQIDRRFINSVFSDESPFTSAPEPDDTSTVSLEDMVEMVQEFRRRAIERPYLREVWFVNKPDDYQRFIGAFPARRPDEVAPGLQPFIWELLHNSPIFTWDSCAELDGCRSQEDWTSFFNRLKRVPNFAMLPGIWLKLSDGRFQKVEDVADLIAAFEASSSADNSG